MDIIMREYGRLLWHSRWFFLLVLLAMASNVALDLSITQIYKNLANGLSKPFSDITYYVLLENFSYLIMALSGIWLSWRVLEIGMIPLELGGMKQLEQRCFDVLLKQRFYFFENHFSGSLVKQANRFVRSFETIIDWFFFQFLGNMLAIIIAFIIFYQQQPEFALYFFLWAIIFIAWGIGYAIWQLKYDERVAVWDSKLGGAYSDGISNIAIVKSFALEAIERKNIHHLAQESYKSRRVAWILMFISYAIQGLLCLAIESLLVYLMIDKWKMGHFSIGEYVLFQSILLLLIRRLWDFGRYFRNFFTALAEAREMAEVFRLADQDVEQDTAQAQAYTIQHGKVTFEDIRFHYDSLPSSCAETTTIATPTDRLFNDFSLHIRAGEKVALVGHSGSGKTSITKLLLRFIEPQHGQISIDDKAINTFTLRSLREQISLVPQQPELFHRSIRDNITLGRNISDHELRAASRRARALDFIEKLPLGFDTLVGERGVKLSGGEKQRIAIARAFLQQAPIILLDEATSALDSLTEQHIQVAIGELIADKTAIVIAHRLATILRMDRIIVLCDGEIVEQGTHHTLLAQQGYYHRMWQHQSNDFLAIE